MKYAILSDVHANASALQRVLNDAAAYGVERIVCLGDCVGYGPRPAETVRLVRTSCADVIVGNHDAAVADRVNPQEFSFTGFAAAAVRRHRAALSKESRAWLKSLPYVVTGDGFVATHGSFIDPSAFYYVETVADAEACFDATESPLVFVGHTHVPQIFVTGASGQVYKLDPMDFTLEDGKRYIVNPGSVGFPREEDGVCRSSYILYDSVERVINFRFLPFAVESVMQRDEPVVGERRRLPLVAACLGVAALLAALAVLALRSVSPRDAPPAAAPLAASGVSLVVTSAAWTVSAPEAQLSPGLKLANGSPPVLLKTRFIDADGKELDSNALEVKRSRTKPYPIPKDAVRAELTVLKMKIEDSPILLSFEPSLKP